MICMQRPLLVLLGQDALDHEFREARAMHHRLLKIQDEHQAILDATAELCAPGITQVGRIYSKLCKRERWTDRAAEGAWRPKKRPALKKTLGERKKALVKVRNADPRWKTALKWLDEVLPESEARGKTRRQEGETDEAFALRTQKRAESGRDLQNRQEVRQSELYKKRQIATATWNYLLDQVKQAKSSVIKLRKVGLPAKWSHPKWNQSNTIRCEKNWKVIEKGPLWWTLEAKLFTGVVRFKAKFGNWHQIPEGARFTTCLLSRRKNGRGWKYSVSVSVEGMPDRSERYATRGRVSLDWGHREHGHAGSKEGLRVFTWEGDDGQHGEILLPIKCRELLDHKDALKSRVDKTYNARKQPEKSRHTYRKRLMLSGVRTEEETLWLRWERRYDARIEATERKIQNIREEAYYQAVRMLRRKYKFFGIEKEESQSLKDQDTEEMTPRRKRQNRDVSARYEFISMIKRYGGEEVSVSARNTTRECPTCGHLSKNGPELYIACEGCGTVRDKDYGACKIILRRMSEVLENAAE